MITIECDDCERTFDIEDEQAGGKVACPYCGDMNRVPEAHGPQAKGLPPDEGPEQDISVVHPAMFRAHPFRFLAITVLFVGGIAMAIYSATSDQSGVWLAWVGRVITFAGAGGVGGCVVTSRVVGELAWGEAAGVGCSGSGCSCERGPAALARGWRSRLRVTAC